MFVQVEAGVSSRAGFGSGATRTGTKLARSRVAMDFESMNTNERKIRVLVAKPGLDGHDRGAKVIASAFRDSGFEVIYTGLHQTPEMIANAAVQEDVDVVALSILSGAHMTLFPRILELLRAEGMDDILILGGGIIPEEDMVALEQMGVGKLFGPGTPTMAPIDFVRDWFSQRESAAH
jgi:methylmalonyl-CoA mutase, C-terminal domain